MMKPRWHICTQIAEMSDLCILVASCPVRAVPNNGRIEYERGFLENGMHTEGTSVYTYCNKGFRITGLFIAVCIGGQWSRTAVRCEGDKILGGLSIIEFFLQSAYKKKPTTTTLHTYLLSYFIKIFKINLDGKQMCT